MSDLNLFIQLVVDGLASGSIYAALALAIVLVNQATGLINFAQGGMAVLSAYIALAIVKAATPLVGPVGGILIGVLGTVVISFVMGAAIERVVMRRFERGDPDTAIVVTVGLLTLITGICGLIWTFNFQPFPWFFSTGESINLGGIAVSVWSLTTFLTIVVIMVLLQLLFRGTKLGLALRAVADNPASSALSGLPVGRLLMIGWGLAAVLGAVAGTLVAPKLQLTPGMLDTALVYALAAVIIGGLGSPIGAVLAALGISVLENLAAAYVPFVGHDLKIAVPFLLLFVILVLRPQGLFGRKVVVRV
jgi:branched-chain amino acid transport system permease protein